jgi:Holliday junction resolvase RusA-like endonuclease
VSRSIEFVAYGDPIPKGSTTRLPNGMTIDGHPSRAKDKAVRKASNARRRAWPEIVRASAYAASVAQIYGEDDRVGSLDGPLDVTATFYLRRPKNETRAQRERIWHTNTPDIDKLLRGVLDPMKKAGAITEDCRVVRVTVEKRYVGRDNLAASVRLYPHDSRPRVVVRVVEIATTE